MYFSMKCKSDCQWTYSILYIVFTLYAMGQNQYSLYLMADKNKCISKHATLALMQQSVK